MSDSVKDMLWELYSKKSPETSDVSLADIMAVKEDIDTKTHDLKHEADNKEAMMAEKLNEVAKARLDWVKSLSMADKGILQASEELMESEDAKAEALADTTEAFREASENSGLLNRA